MVYLKICFHELVEKMGSYKPLPECLFFPEKKNFCSWFVGPRWISQGVRSWIRAAQGFTAEIRARSPPNSRNHTCESVNGRPA